MRGPDELFQTARLMELASKEPAFIIDQIAKKGPGDCPDEVLYRCLYIVGLMGSIENEAIVQKFINCPQDPVMSALAMQILCDDWGLTSKYIHQLKVFIRGVEWDEDDDIRISALSSAGNYLKSVENLDLLQVVFETFLDDHANEVLQKSTYCALATAMGQGYEEYQKDEKPNPEIIKRVKDKLVNSEEKI